jgi:hypothetical protein
VCVGGGGGGGAGEGGLLVQFVLLMETGEDKENT